MTESDLLYASPEDLAFYKKCTAGLPPVTDGLPYVCGPHNLKAFRRFIELANPTSIFEIGFNMGYSASMFMELTGCPMVSIDISDKPETLLAAKVMNERYGDRFKFIHIDSKKMWDRFDEFKGKFDFAFIDGGHLEDDVMNDLRLCISLGIEWLALDDWLPQFGPGVQLSVKNFPIREVEIINNNALFKC